MYLNNWENDPHNPKKSLPLVMLLWRKFLIQPIQYKVITLMVIAVTAITLVVFYTSFIIWQVFCFVLSKTILKGVEWYLQIDYAKQNK